VVNKKEEIAPLNNNLKAVVVDTHAGFISFEAIKWLAVQDIPVFFLNWRGELEANFSPSSPKAYTDLKIRQIQAAPAPPLGFPGELGRPSHTT
jgi:CRISPR/Cas system-associated endonuclease Cas1